MHGNHIALAEAYTTSPYAAPRTIYTRKGYVEETIPIFSYHKGSTYRVIILAVLLILSSVTIMSLEIANVAIDGNKVNQGSLSFVSTDKVAAGIWCGFISLLAATFILSIVFVENKRLAATYALAIVVLALLFIVVLIGLIGNTLRYHRFNEELTDIDITQDRIFISMISIAGFNFILLLLYIILYIRVFRQTTNGIIHRYE